MQPDARPPHGPEPTPVVTPIVPVARLLAALHTPFRWFSGGVAVLALIASTLLLLFDGAPQLLPGLRHAPVSAAPLLLIGVAYISLQPLIRPSPLELLKRLMLGTAFILWGIDQLLPAGSLATRLGDVVIALYVIDLGLIIITHLQREDWETP
jgi:hypothetical protein